MNRINNFFYSLILPFKGNKGLRRYVLFIFISFSFWFLTIMSKRHETTLTIPVAFENFPLEKIIDKESNDQKLEVTVTAPGFNLLIYKLFNSKKIKLDIEKANWRISQNVNKEIAFWNSKKHWKEIKKSLSGSMEISSDGKSFLISPEEINLIFTPKYSKLVMIEVKRDLKFRDQFRLSDRIRYFPDSITIYGKKEIIDTINKMSTNILRKDDLHKDSKNKLKLKEINYADYNKEQEINVEMSIERFAEKTIDIPINVINLPKGYTIRILPSVIKVKVSAPVDKFKLINEKLFNAVVDYNDILSESKGLNVRLTKTAEFATIHWYNPKNIEYILIKE